MKKLYASLFFLSLFQAGFAQLNSVQIGTAGNLYTTLIGNVNSLAANDETQTVVLAHRNNPNVNGGSTADFRYDVSTNGGTSFTIDQGVLNPNANQTLNASRYPNAVIHNPTGNTTATNAYMGYYGSVVDVNANNWNGHIAGVARLNNNPSTFTETVYTVNGGDALVAKSLVNGANGEFWAVDHGFDSGTNIFSGEIIVSKGVWNSTTNDIDWAVDTIFDPTYDVSLTGNPAMSTQSLNIAFAPNGMDGWLAYTTDMTLDNEPILNPTFYYTTDGGVTWDGPIIGAVQNFADVEAFTGANGTTEFVTAAFDADLTVDANGVPHFVTVLGPGPNTAHSVFNPTPVYSLGVYDITVDTSITGDCQLHPNFLGEVETFRGTFGAAVQDNRPQASRTPDGTKVFLGWLDSDPSGTNTDPDLFMRAINVSTQMMTPVVNVTGGDPVWDESALFALFAEETFDNGGTYNIPTTFVELTATDLDPINFHYIQNITVSDADFTIPIPMFTTSVFSANDPLCNGDNTGVVSVLGATGSTGSPLNTGLNSGVYTSASNTEGLIFSPPSDIVITGIKIPTSVGQTPQNVQVAIVAGTNPSSTAPFTTVFLDTGVVDTSMIPVFIPVSSTESVGILAGRGGATLSLPSGGNSGLNATIGSGTSTVRSFSYPGNINAGEAPSGSCLIGTGAVGQVEIQFVTSNATFLWDDPMAQTGPVATDLTSGTYNVTITSTQGCTETQTVTLTDPPLINFNATATDVLCSGDTTGTIDLSLNGGFPPYNYQWNNGSTDEDQPSLSEGTYTVTITDSIGCELTETFVLNEPDTISVPFVDVTNLDCWMDASGEIDVTASGGVGNYSYDWLPGGFSGSNPTGLEAGNYFVTVTDGNGCTTVSQYFVDEPDPIDITVFSQPDWNGAAGQASVNVQGDFPPFTLLWNTGSPASIITGLASGTYTITVTDDNGCTNTAEAVVDDVTSVNDLEDNLGQVKLYPNPTADQLNLQIDLNATQDVTVTMTDLTGRTLLNERLGAVRQELHTMDVRQQPPGIYLVRIQLGNQSVVHKISITR